MIRTLAALLAGAPAPTLLLVAALAVAVLVVLAVCSAVRPAVEPVRRPAGAGPARTLVLRLRDPDAAGRPRPRAP